MMKPTYSTEHGKAYCANSLALLEKLPKNSIDLVLTSPPFALTRKKQYGNVTAEDYCEWFTPFANAIARALKPRGSLVIDIAGSWKKGEPVRSLYHFELLLALCRPRGPFQLAQEFYWYNPAKMPSPAQWVTIHRIRVKDSVNPIWWLSKSSTPKASNLRVLKPYSKSMQDLLRNGYNHGRRPSGHVVSKNWNRQNGGAIPSNLIVASNTRSTDGYLNTCREVGLEPHPARFVEAVPEFFVKFLTKPGDVVLDPFAGSNVVGAVAERLDRNWISAELNREYVVGSSFRFPDLGKRVYNRWARSHTIS